MKRLYVTITGLTWLWATALGVLLVVLLLSFVVTAPPRHIVIAAGPPGSYFDVTAHRYADALRKEGLETEILNTQGALENIRLIDAPDAHVDFAFIHGGLTDAQASPNLMSLGSVGYEPVWIFYRTALGPLDRINDLQGRRVSIGPEGSGVRVLARKFLTATGINETNTRLLGLEDDQVRDGLRAGTVDAVFVMDPPESPRIHALMETPGVRAMPMNRAEALRRNFPFLHVRILGRGTVDLKRDLPAQDTPLVATTAVVAARKNTHSAVVYLLMSIIDAAHEAPTLMSDENEFPADRDVDVPLAPQAERYYAGGKPFLQRYLPFWVASVLERLLAVALPLAALFFPFMNFVPKVYHWRIRNRITRCYQELIELERQVRVLPREKLNEEFERLVRVVDEYLDERKVPVSYSNEIYVLKEHIELVRSKIGV